MQSEYINYFMNYIRLESETKEIAPFSLESQT